MARSRDGTKGQAHPSRRWLALACAVAEVPFLELRAISNRVGARPPEDWDLPAALTALSQAMTTLFP